MAWTVIVNGVPYNDTMFSPRGYPSAFPAIIADIAAVAGRVETAAAAVPTYWFANNTVAGITVLTGADSYGTTLNYTAGIEAVYKNGVRLRPGVDYTRTNATTITLASPTATDDDIMVEVRNPTAPVFTTLTVGNPTAGTHAINRDFADGRYAQVANEATAAQFRNNTADKYLTTDQAWAAAAYVSLGNLTGTVAIDFTGFIKAVGTMTGNVTLGATTGILEGKEGTFRLVQDATGGRTLSHNATYWVTESGAALDIDTSANAVNLISYEHQPGGKVFIGLKGKKI